MQKTDNSLKMKRIFKFIFITLFVDLLAFTLILPLLPKLLDYYETNDKSNAYRLFDEKVKIIQKILGVPGSYNQVLLAGLLGSWFSFLQFVSSPFLGALSDRYGRRKVMIITMSGSVLSYVMWLLATENFALFVLSRTIGGLSKANVGLSLAIVSDVSDEASRGQGMAIVGSSFSLAFIVGPSLGAYLSTLASGQSNLHKQLITYPSLIAIFLSTIGLAMVAILLGETNISIKNKKKHGQDKLPRNKREEQTTLRRAFHYVSPKSLFNFTLVGQASSDQRSCLITTGLVYFYYLLFYSGLEFTLSFLTHIRFQFTSMDQGKLYLYSGLLMAIIQGGYIRRIKGGREAIVSLIGLTMIVPSFIFMGLSTQKAHIYYSLTMYAISSAIVVPCLTTIISSQSPAEYKGTVMGTFRSIGALARAIGPLLASFLFWTLGPTTCYIIGGLALLLPHHLMRGLYSKMRLQDNQPSVHTKVVKSEMAKAN